MSIPPHVINARRGGRPVHIANFLTSAAGRCPVHLAKFLTSGRCPVHLAKFLISAAGRCPVHLAIYGEGGGRQAGGEVIVRSRGSHKREKKSIYTVE